MKVIQKLILLSVQLYQPSEWVIAKNTKYKYKTGNNRKTYLPRVTHQPVRAKPKKIRRGSRHRAGSQSSQNSLLEKRSKLARTRTRIGSQTSLLSRFRDDFNTPFIHPSVSAYLEEQEEESFPESTVSHSFSRVLCFIVK